MTDSGVSLKKIGVLVFFALILVGSVSAVKYVDYLFREGTISPLVVSNIPVNDVNVIGFVCADRNCNSVSSSLFGGTINNPTVLSSSLPLPADLIQLAYPTQLQSRFGYGIYFYKDGYVLWEQKPKWKGNNNPNNPEGPFTKYLSRMEGCNSEILDFNVDNSVINLGGTVNFDANLESPQRDGGPLGFIPPSILDQYQMDADVVLNIFDSNNNLVFSDGANPLTFDPSSTQNLGFSFTPSNVGSYTAVIETTVPDSMCTSTVSEQSVTSFSVTSAGICGDGLIDPGEQCDDSNTANGDGCSSGCQVENGWICSGQPSLCSEICGDGIEVGNEECDDNNLVSGDWCSSACEDEYCGDDVLQSAFEECDDGNTNNGDGCSSVCELEDLVVCGDGILDPSEECDDGDTISGDGCSSTCQLENPLLCGNSVINFGETCDDGNIIPGDGCDEFCQLENLPYCGNNVIDPGESCDGVINNICSDFDSYTGGILGCTANCQIDTSLCTGGTTGICGDGAIDTGEECDGTNFGPITGCSDIDNFISGVISCDASCNIDTSLCDAPICGDGDLDPGEGCDDGNLVNGDGCDNVCQIEVPPSCGDGVIDPGEECDDGNLVSGDWCNSVCEDEYCGDDVLQMGLGEQCDDGNTNNGDGCNSNCLDETSLPLCGNNFIDPGESCDGVINNICSDFDSYTGGILGCTANCQIDTSLCTGGTTGICGDGAIDTGEECDGINFGPITGCSDIDNFISGVISCDANCNIDTTDCILAQCSDGIDNDGDGLIDYPNDPGCSSPLDNDESDVCNDDVAIDLALQDSINGILLNDFTNNILTNPANLITGNIYRVMSRINNLLYDNPLFENMEVIFSLDSTVLGSFTFNRDNLYGSNIVINEFVVDPQQDWDGSGTITTSDEWFELYNPTTSDVDLTGWRLELVDTTPATYSLAGTLASGDYLVILNPIGYQNNDGRLELYDDNNNLVDAVSYGSWDDGNTADNAPDGNANDLSDECLARVSNGLDTDDDSVDIIKTDCTQDLGNGWSYVLIPFANLDTSSFAPGTYSLSVDANLIGVNDCNVADNSASRIVNLFSSICGNGLIETGETCDDSNTASGDGCDSSCQIETGWICSGEPSICIEDCGDSLVVGDEECDDGNLDEDDLCSNSCTLTLCGDSILQNPNGIGLGGPLNDGNEECDDGANNNLFNSCTNVCTFTYCGDGIIQQPNGEGIVEECDDNDQDNGDGCSSTCQLENPLLCGNSIVDPGEQCDDGANGDDTDGCYDSCIFTYCSDGIVQQPNGYNQLETCDDGDTISGDGCSSTCELENPALCGNNAIDPGEQCDGTDLGLETCQSLGFDSGFLSCDVGCFFDYSGCFDFVCGNSIVEGTEDCDDGANGDDTDLCFDDCTFTFCGDNVIQNPNGIGLGGPLNDGDEDCDDGANNNLYNSCTNVCTLTFCGDGYTQTPNGLGVIEQCDDGNIIPGDGCDSFCQVEVPPNCGDGSLDPGEQCDDGNLISGDGCSGVCVDELCGEGILQMGLGEQCDDGNVIPGDGCDSNCLDETSLPLCGNNFIDPGESCDGGLINNQCADFDSYTGGLIGCTANCQIDTSLCTGGTTGICGDGNIDTGEECDGVNFGPINDCGDIDNFISGPISCDASCNIDTSLCDAPICGDGDLDPGETCDDGNIIPGDGCDDLCQVEVLPNCRDGNVDPGEQCDDGNLDNTDGCLNTCQFASCGDSFVWIGVEICDDGNLDETDLCANSCTLTFCGDRTLQNPNGRGTDGATGIGDEECDINDFGTSTCADTGPYVGDLICTGSCIIDRSQCVLAQCSDGIDNDGDGLIDYPNDPGCSSPLDNDEIDPIGCDVFNQLAGSGSGSGSYSSNSYSSTTMSTASSESNVRIGISPGQNTNDVAPLIFMDPNSRLVLDDNVNRGRLDCVTVNGVELCERQNNYAFEGEQIMWDVFVYDKNGINKIRDVFVAINPNQQELLQGNDIEANCGRNSRDDLPVEVCNINPDIEFNPRTMGWYTCILSVETPMSMQGEYWVAAEVEDLTGLIGVFDERERWFLNPYTGLTIIGNLGYDLDPGETGYSTIALRNDAEAGSGVMLDMFVSGTDFYDSSNVGGQCPDSNVLRLSNYDYYAVSGSYTTQTDIRADTEGYVGIGYGNNIRSSNEIIFNDFISAVPPHGYRYVEEGYSAGNVLSRGSEMSITLRLELPEPCNGDYNRGNIYFWAEAV